MKEINAFELTKTPFEMIGKDWMLITAKSGERVNMMTASWGGMGVLWSKNVAFIFIRPTRFTKKLVDSSDRLSLTFFNEKYRKALNYCGKASGYNEDKIAGSGLTLSEIDGVPTFIEAETTIVCRKMYAQELSETCFFDKECCEKMYPGKDFHTMYVAEIEKIYINK